MKYFTCRECQRPFSVPDSYPENPELCGSCVNNIDAVLHPSLWVDTRPSWQDTFLAMAFTISRRSHDAQTKHGCVITTRDHRVLGVGFNGFPRGMNDRQLPNTRPAKYPWMRHSERNAVKNCTAKPVDAIAYVTGPPCNDCLVELWESGVRCIVHCKGHATFDAKAMDQEFRKEFLRHCGDRLKIEEVEPNFSWFADLGRELNEK